MFIDLPIYFSRYSTIVNATDKWGFTPLHEATQKGRTQLCSLLLAHGADPNLKNQVGCLSFYPSFGFYICLSIYVSVYIMSLFICLSFELTLVIFLSIHQSINLSTYISMYIIYLSIFVYYLSIYLCNDLSITYLPIYLNRLVLTSIYSSISVLNV